MIIIETQSVADLGRNAVSIPSQRENVNDLFPLEKSQRDRKPG
jgi:hypothetical protein